MRILNYGAGAVGLGIDSCLLSSGCSVDIISRPETVRALKEHGLKRTGIFKEHLTPPSRFGAYVSLNDLPSQEYDYILVSTKSFDSRTAAQDICHTPRLYNKQTRIILFQNGWGNADLFTSFFPKEQIFCARVITGFIRPALYTVEVTVHADAIHIGSLFQEETRDIEDLCQAITRGGIPCQATKSIGKDLWAKMLYNCALNPLGAILNVPYGHLGQRDETKELMNTIVSEVFDVMKAAGYHTHWSTAEAYLDIFYSRLLPLTAGHHSSTLQDIRAGKRTEVDALNGIVVQLARSRNINVPANQTVYRMVKFLEQKP